MEIQNNRSLGGISLTVLTRKAKAQGVRGEAINLIDGTELCVTISASFSKD